MVLVVGDSVTETGIVSFNQLSSASYCEIGVSSFREMIRDTIKSRLDLVVSDDVIREMMDKMIDLSRKNRGAKAKIFGRSYSDGSTGSGVISEEEIFSALSQMLNQLSQTVTSCLYRASDQLVADVADTGIKLVGGGANLPGLATFLAESLSIRIEVPEYPENAIVNGLALLHSQTA
jgi:rod shape-determining protein MreB